MRANVFDPKWPEKKELLDRFNKEYERLYRDSECPLVRDTVSKLAGEFDERIKRDGAFHVGVLEFVHYRKDAVVSDRECAAYMLAIR